jgi:type II secretory pathway pseudopilin PulG
MLNGLITILAVLAGGVLTYLVQARLDSRRAERERQRDEAAAERERERASGSRR